MLFPELLYQLSSRDQQVTWLDPYLRFVDQSTAAVDVSSTFTIEDGKALVLQSATVEATPGGAQTTTWTKLLVRGPISTDLNQSAYLAGSFTASGENAAKFLNWSGSLIVPPQWRITGRAVFSAGAIANNVRLSLLGVLIPIGNIQRI